MNSRKKEKKKTKKRKMVHGSRFMGQNSLESFGRMDWIGLGTKRGAGRGGYRLKLLKDSDQFGGGQHRFRSS